MTTWAPAVLALLVLCGPQQGEAATPSTYAVSATRSGYVDVSLSRAVTLQMHASRVSGGGWYAGYYVQPLGRPPGSGYGELWIREFAHAGYQPVALPLGDDAVVFGYGRGTSAHRLAAGKYRIHVFGAAPVRARLSLAGASRSRSLVASRRSSVTAVWRDVTFVAAGQNVPGVSAAELPITIASASSLSLVASYVVRHGPMGTVTTAGAMCLASSHPVACDNGASSYSHTDEQTRQHGTGLAGVATGWAIYYPPQSLEPGGHTARFVIASGGVVDRVVFAAFSLAF